MGKFIKIGRAFLGVAILSMWGSGIYAMNSQSVQKPSLAKFIHKVHSVSAFFKPVQSSTYGFPHTSLFGRTVQALQQKYFKFALKTAKSEKKSRGNALNLRSVSGGVGSLGTNLKRQLYGTLILPEYSNYFQNLRKSFAGNASISLPGIFSRLAMEFHSYTGKKRIKVWKIKKREVYFAQVGTKYIWTLGPAEMSRNILSHAKSGVYCPQKQGALQDYTLLSSIIPLAMENHSHKHGNPQGNPCRVSRITPLWSGITIPQRPYQEYSYPEKYRIFTLSFVKPGMSRREALIARASSSHVPVKLPVLSLQG